MSTSRSWQRRTRFFHPAPRDRRRRPSRRRYQARRRHRGGILEVGALAARTTTAGSRRPRWRLWRQGVGVCGGTPLTVARKGRAYRGRVLLLVVPEFEIACSADVADLAMGSVSCLGSSHVRLLYLPYTLFFQPTCRVTLPTDVSLVRRRCCCVSVLEKMYRQLMACSP